MITTPLSFAGSLTTNTPSARLTSTRRLVILPEAT
jgi:hypothetical protein